MLLQALSTGHKIGLGLAVAGFAGFALIVSMLVPRWSPQFPGRGLKLFLVVIVVLFLGMLAAVEFLGREGGKAEAGGETTTETTATTATTPSTRSTTTAPTTTQTTPSSTTVHVSEVEYKIKLPKSSLSAGSYTFDVENDGKVTHNLVVKGPGVNSSTPNLDAGKSDSLKVDLKAGTYDLYCSIPGHKQLGMDLKLTVS